MFRMIGSTLVLALLGALLAGSIYASYAGVGIVDIGSPSARQGSTFGPYIFGGGPGDGK